MQRDATVSSSRFRILSLVPFWLTLAGASLEVVVLWIGHRAQPMRHLSPDFVWMAPLALLAVTATVATPVVLLARRWPTRAVWFVALAAPAALVALNLLMLVPGLAHYGAAVLALGLAVQAARLALAFPEGASRVARIAGQVAAVVLLAFVVAGWLRPSPPGPSSGPPPASVGAAPAGRAPNVVLITLDTVRAANLSLYGYPRATTPYLSRLAERGVVFDAAFTTAPWTLPSHASMFTGRWPYELSTSYDNPLDGTAPTLAEHFRTRGYRTAGFVANLRYCGAATGLARGFDRYEDFPRSLGEVATSSTLVRTVANNFRLREWLQNDQHLDRVRGEDVITRATRWVSDERDQPFFLFLNLFDAHEPYLPPAPFDRAFGPGRPRGRYSPLHHWLWNPAVGHGNMGDAERQEEIDAYDGAIAHVDRQVGQLIDTLDARGMLRDTIVAITSDHGEEFAEHGVYEHGYSLYQPSLRVPLVLVDPRDPVGRRIGRPVSLRDLAATIVDLRDPADRGALPGVSLTGLWRDAAGAAGASDPSPVLSDVSQSPGQPDWFPSSKGDMRSLVLHGLHYIRNGDGREELYDLERDPWERQDLAAHADRAGVLAEARSVLAQLTRGGGGPVR